MNDYETVRAVVRNLLILARVNARDTPLGAVFGDLVDAPDDAAFVAAASRHHGSDEVFSGRALAHDGRYAPAREAVYFALVATQRLAAGQVDPRPVRHLANRVVRFLDACAHLANDAETIELRTVCNATLEPQRRAGVTLPETHPAYAVLLDGIKAAQRRLIQRSDAIALYVKAVLAPLPSEAP